MSTLDRYFPWAVVVAGAAYLVSQAIPPSAKPGEMRVEEAAKLPVLDGGRLKPLDTLARTSLMSISSRSEFEDKNGKMRPAIVWLLEVMACPDERSAPAADYKVFRVENDQVLNFLSLKERPGFRYSLNEILGDDEQTAKLKREFDRIEALDPKKTPPIFDAKMAELSKKIDLYLKLAQRQVPQAVPPQQPGGEWRSVARIDRVLSAPFETQAHEMAQAKVLGALVATRLKRAKLDPESLTPEQHDQVLNRVLSELNEDQLKAIRFKINAETHKNLAVIAEMRRPAESPEAAAFMRVLQAYRAGTAGEFNGALADYKKDFLGQYSAGDERKVNFEAFFNHFSPFYHCAALFVVVFVLAASSWLGWSGPLNRAATYLALLALTVHTLAIIARMYIQGRPPVTNLYSSAVFIGWGAAGVSLLLERWYRNGVGNVVGSLLAFATLLVAHHLSASGDTLEMMQAVLDTNFWLATHVTTVTLGYTATYVAGIIAIVFLVWGLFFTTMDAAVNRKLSQMLYGVICFATLLSFVGTVLGGIWADQSWGRFWGWDPKENGAVLIVLWNALILHARWGGLVKQRGIALLAIVGIMITTWSWFGTNQLGVGLHAYGFNKSLALGCRYVWLSCLALIGIGLLPMKYWRSFSPETQQARKEQARRQQQGEKRRSRVVTTSK